MTQMRPERPNLLSPLLAVSALAASAAAFVWILVTGLGPLG